MKHKMKRIAAHERALLHMIGQTVEQSTAPVKTVDIVSWTGLSKPTVLKWMSDLVNKGLVVRDIAIHRAAANAVRFEYRLRPTVMRLYRVGEYKNDYWSLLNERVLHERGVNV